MQFEWNFAYINKVWSVGYRHFEKGINRPLPCKRYMFILNGDVGERIIHLADGTTLKHGPRELRFMPKGAEYWVDRITPGDYWCVTFELDKDIKENAFSIPVQNYRAMRNLFSAVTALEKDLYNDTRFAHLMVHKYLYEIIIQLLQEQEKQYIPSQKQLLLQPALDAINAHFCDGTDLSVASLTKLCGISETYFRQLFRCCFSTNPKEYIQNMRMDRAKLLLCRDTPIHLVAQLCGYAEPSSFTREFTRRVGVSPSQFRLSFNYE